uniref:Uncharacterized protein n=1 Tax=Romanomermis culicivorax TaxID=13658 RepID=A0A915KYF9_ROMCU
MYGYKNSSRSIDWYQKLYILKNISDNRNADQSFAASHGKVPKKGTNRTFMMLFAFNVLWVEASGVLSTWKTRPRNWQRSWAGLFKTWSISSAMSDDSTSSFPIWLWTRQKNI